jgi:uncharacterized membrane protein YadS
MFTILLFKEYRYSLLFVWILKKEVGFMIETIILITVGVIIFGGSVVARVDEAIKNKEKRESM